MVKKILIALVLVIAVIALGMLLSSKKGTEVLDPAEKIPAEATGAPVVLGTFNGVLPCADCEGIAMELMLVQNAHTSEGSYSLVETYLGVEGENNIFPSSGAWALEQGTKQNANAVVYVLNPEQPELTRRFMVIDENTLELLDQEGNEIESDLPYKLFRQ